MPTQQPYTDKELDDTIKFLTNYYKKESRGQIYTMADKYLRTNRNWLAWHGVIGMGATLKEIIELENSQCR